MPVDDQSRGAGPTAGTTSDSDSPDPGPVVAERESSGGSSMNRPARTRRYREPADSDDVSDDDRDVGWGERSRPSGRDDEWYLRERPPHHG